MWLQLNFVCSKILLILYNEDYPYVSSATSGEGGGGIGEDIAKGIVNGISKAFIWLAENLFNLISPFVNWGSKFIIIACVIIFFCNHDKRCVTIALKWFFIFLVFNLVRSVVK